MPAQDANSTLRSSELRTAITRHHKPNATLLFCKILIVSALEKAAECDPETGMPTPEAAESLDWLQARTDWSTVPLKRRLKAWGSPAPPPEIRAEFYGSFEWACSWLNEHPDDVRREGLPQDVRFKKYAEGDVRTTVRKIGGTIRGLSHVFRLRDEARLHAAERKREHPPERREPAPVQPLSVSPIKHANLNELQNCSSGSPLADSVSGIAQALGTPRYRTFFGNSVLPNGGVR